MKDQDHNIKTMLRLYVIEEQLKRLTKEAELDPDTMIYMDYGSRVMGNHEGMRRQLDSLSHLGLLSRFVGMLTDSRSFISYPRHEYFRRILCDVLGQDVEQGKLPASELDFIGKMVEDISYNNAKNYFNF